MATNGDSGECSHAAIFTISGTAPPDLKIFIQGRNEPLTDHFARYCSNCGELVILKNGRPLRQDHTHRYPPPSPRMPESVLLEYETARGVAHDSPAAASGHLLFALIAICAELAGQSVASERREAMRDVTYNLQVKINVFLQQRAEELRGALDLADQSTPPALSEDERTKRLQAIYRVDSTEIPARLKTFWPYDGRISRQYLMMEVYPDADPNKKWYGDDAVLPVFELVNRIVEALFDAPDKPDKSDKP